MTKEQLMKIIKLHQKWLNGEKGGVKANLQSAYLQGADLQGANLYGADLPWADLEGVDFREVNLQEANLQEANLQGTDLQGANLQGANLQGTNLQGANLQGVYIQSAYLQGADLQGAILPSFQIAPPSGDFICWKKGQDDDIIKLKCPWFARRCSSLIGRKIRLELAIVIKIEDKNGREKQQSTGTRFPGLIYKVGEFVKPDSYNSDIRVECSNGIHAFITRKEAEEW